MQAIIPYSVLCPTTTIFFLSLISFLFGIFKFNSLHTEDIDLVDGYSYFIIVGLIFVGRQNDLVSLQAFVPIYIWSATMLLPIGHWLFKTFSPEIYWRYRQAIRLQKEAIWKVINCREETVGDVEAGGEVAEEGGVEERINEETPLRRDEGRIG
jgi:hypothetical protein